MSHCESEGKSNEYYTPKYLFDAMGVRFNMDVAAPVDRTYCHVPADHFITENSLDLEWNGFVWMNPPFGGRNGIVPWLHKLKAHGNGIALTPDRTSCDWWQDAVECADCHLAVRGKIKFIKPDGTTGDQPSNGTTLIAYGKLATRALSWAEHNKLGLVFSKT